MVWCGYCVSDQVAEHNEGFICCTGCGRVLDDHVFSSEPTFSKSATGQSQLVGNIVKQTQYGTYTRIVDDGSGAPSGYQSNSYQRTLDKGRQEIKDIASALSISGGDDTVAAAHRIYVMAVERNFTKGRRTAQVAAACLYIICRQNDKPFLLIDFSDSLQTSVYVLGAVFLQLCALLRLDSHPMVMKPVDPSLFIHRFTDRLVHRISSGEVSSKTKFCIANTALRIVASMKQDWMQTGRRPSGICGAALLLSSRIHGLECSKSDVESIVYVCKATISKRLLEFSNTYAGSLTPEEFEAQAKQREQEMQAYTAEVGKSGIIKELLCEHKDFGGVHFAHGLCKTCYDDFIKISGGLQGGAEPPAFQRAEKERQRLKRKLLKECFADVDEIIERECKKGTKGEQIDGDDLTTDSCVTENSKHGKCEHMDEGPDSLSDIDDLEVTGYLMNEDEVKMKTMVWTEMNKDYLQEQAAKEAARKAQAESMAAVNITGTPAEIAAAAVLLSKKAKKQKQGDTTPSKPPETPAEATRQMLERKRLGSRLNLDALEKMFDGKESEENTLKKEDVIAEESEENTLKKEDVIAEVDNSFAEVDKSFPEVEKSAQEDDDEEEYAEDIPSYSYIYGEPVDEEFYEEY